MKQIISFFCLFFFCIAFSHSQVIRCKNAFVGTFSQDCPGAGDPLGGWNYIEFKLAPGETADSLLPAYNRISLPGAPAYYLYSSPHDTFDCTNYTTQDMSANGYDTWVSISEGGPLSTTIRILTPIGINPVSVDSVCISVMEPCPNSSYSGPLSACLGDTMSFFNLDTSAISWEWLWDGLIISTDTHLTYVPGLSGLATLSLVALGSTCNDTFQTLINVNMPVVVDLGPDRVLCSGTSFTLDATTPGTSNYIWCDGSINPLQLVTLPGIYCVTVSSGSCEASDSIIFTGLGSPAISIDLDSSLCPIISFSAISIGDSVTSWSWNFGDNLGTSNAKDTLYQYAGNGTYTIELISGNACGADTAEHLLTLDCILNASIPISAEGVNFYPNPNSGILYIETRDLASRFENVRVFDVKGMLLKEYTIAEEINISDLPPGLYIICISSREEFYQRKILLR